MIIQTLLHPADRVDGRVDAVEARLDLYDVDPAALRKATGKPVVATVRRKCDGGAFAGGERRRKELFGAAARADWVDVEVDADPAVAPAGPRRIVSFHDVGGMPDDLDGIFERCLLRGGDLVKIAATPRDAVQAFRLLDLPLRGIGMGPYGEFTRVLAPLTYCANDPVAPGMPTPSDLLDLFRARRIGSRTGLFGVAGDPIAHSRSPAIHNPALERDSIDAVYLRFRVGDLASFWPVFLGHGGRGLSVTAPLKVQAAHLATRPDADVSECGAANTLLADGSAHNTDLRAFLDLLPRGPRDALVLGAGGSARAAVAALRRLGHTVRVWARRPAEAHALGVPLAPRIEPASIVVNTTPLDPPPAPFLLDLRYGPGITPPAAGVGGLDFLLAQARHQYRLFTGHEL